MPSREPAEAHAPGVAVATMVREASSVRGAAQKTIRWEQLSARLEERVEILFAIAYGSAIVGGPFRDVDVAVFVDRELVPAEKDLDYEVALTNALKEPVPCPLDVRVVNDAPLPFRYSVSRGRPLAARNRRALVEFLERAWDEYLDFEPVARRYLLELA